MAEEDTIMVVVITEEVTDMAMVVIMVVVTGMVVTMGVVIMVVVTMADTDTITMVKSTITNHQQD